MEIVEREYVLLRRRQDSRAMTRKEFETFDYLPDDRVLGFRPEATAADRSEAERIASNRFGSKKKTVARMKAMDVEYHMARVTSLRLLLAYGGMSIATFCALKTLMGATVATLLVMESFGSTGWSDERARRTLLTPNETYLRFVVDTDARRATDMEKEKQTVIEYRNWREKGAN